MPRGSDEFPQMENPVAEPRQLDLFLDGRDAFLIHEVVTSLVVRDRIGAETGLERLRDEHPVHPDLPALALLVAALNSRPPSPATHVTVTAGIDPFNGLPDPADPTVATLGPCSQAVSTCFRYNFTVEAGKPSVTAMLTWPGVSDFDLYLVQEGTQVAMSANDPTTNPVTNEETFTASLRPGDYEVVVAAWIVVQDTFSIAITFE